MTSREEALKWAVIPHSHDPKDCLAQGETMTYTCDCDDKAREVLAAALREAQENYQKALQRLVDYESEIDEGLDRAERAEQERDTLRAENERLREKKR